MSSFVVSQFEETATGDKAQFHFYGLFGTTKVVPCYNAIQIETLPVLLGACELT
jgi:hypothetical protein